MTILLPQILPIANPEHYKLHLASWNGEDEPLDVFVRDRDEWDGWNRWRATSDDFSREFIFSLIAFHPQADRWLFGGAYRIRSRRRVTHGPGYDIELLDSCRPFIGRLKLIFKRTGRTKAVYFEKYYETMVVAELLASPYTGEPFVGFENIDLRFTELEAIVRSQRPDWKTALENAKGVYLITDSSNGKRYVGSAYGAGGLWSRLECYAGTGHGYNDELTQLIKANGITHARRFFRLALLEHCPSKMDQNDVVGREGFWKEVLQTRVPLGYNKN